MGARLTRRTSSHLYVVVLLAIAASIGSTGVAEAFSPAVQFVETVSAYNSVSPKMAIAMCPFGKAVLGGTAVITGQEGQVAIQSAFPKFDIGLARYVFVVKATEDVSGTAGSWSVTAGAYCTNSVVPAYYTQPSGFDSVPIKSVEVTCPEDMRVVGMGAELTTVPGEPATLVGTTPPLSVVLKGFSVDTDLTTVTAEATEVGAAIADGWGGNWQVIAVAACAYPVYFDGLELVSAKEGGGGFTKAEIESRVDIGCPVGKKVIAAGSKNEEHDMGQWYLDRLSRYNAVTNRIVGEAFRNAELGTVLMTQYLYGICTDK
jgi:hypothetical protein